MKVNHMSGATRAAKVAANYKIPDKATTTSQPLATSWWSRRVPFPDSFYKPAERELISGSHRMLSWTAVGVYTATLMVFVALFVAGMLVRQELKTVQIVSVPVADKNTVCVNLGKYSGAVLAYPLDPAAVMQALADPVQQPVNCPTPEDVRLPADAQLDWAGQVTVVFTNAYFASYTDCLAKIPVIVDKIGASMQFDYQRYIVKAAWKPYTSQEEFGDNLASVQLRGYDEGFFSDPDSFTTTIRPWYKIRDANGQIIPSCLVDASNLAPPTDVIGHVIPGSAIDLFFQHRMTQLVQELLSDHYDEICDPFRAQPPFQCTTTVYTTPDPLSVLGASFANAQAFMTVAFLVAGWIIGRLTKDVIPQSDCDGGPQAQDNNEDHRGDASITPDSTLSPVSQQGTLPPLSGSGQ